MTSPVDTSVKFFTSEMTGAPTLNGVAGALISVLDACLVSGFGATTATGLSVTDGVATLTFSGSHAASVDSVILVAGSSISALNGEQKVIARRSGEVDFATDEADGTASGTITFKMAPAGWTKAFSGTNLAAYKIADPTAHGGGMYLRVDDTGTMTARVVGYVSMIDISTGTGPFPTSVQLSGGGYWAKARAANSTPVPWALFADGRAVILSVAPGVASTASWSGMQTRIFGDCIPRRLTGDPFAVLLAISAAGAAADIGGGSGSLDITPAATNGFYLPASYSGLGGSTVGVCKPYFGSTSVGSGNDAATAGTFPSPVSGELFLSKMRVQETVATNMPPRADVPGFFFVPQAVPVTTFPAFSVVPGSGDLAGRNLMAIPSNTSNAAASGNGAAFVDITGPWR